MDSTKSNGAADGADGVDLLRKMRFTELSPEHVVELKAWAQIHGFDIWANHVWGKLEPDGHGGMKLVPMVQIHGLCAKAHATGEFAGVDKAIPSHNADGTLLEVTITVYRMVAGVRQPFAGTAYWREYYPGPGFWDAKPEFMLGKCALAIALRWAFPLELGGCYLPEELELGRMAAASPAMVAKESEEDLPNTPMQLELRLVDYGLTDPTLRERVIAGFRVKLAHLLEMPQFYMEVFKAVRARPELYGGKSPAAA